MNLGKNAKDKLTGFSGVIIGKCEYLTGCTQYALQPKTKNDGAFIESRWFDEGRLAAMAGEEFSKSDLVIKENGADFAPPQL